MARYSSIYGHREVLSRLGPIRDSHGAFLFTGPVNIGKRTVAFETSRYSLCIKDGLDGCTCNSCSVNLLDHPDFLCIGTSGKVKVADIETLLEFVEKKPFLSKRRIAVIDNADNSTWEASNRLLKILEEPPTGFQFILIASNLSTILPTILSRCIKYTFGSLTQEERINVVWKKLGFDLPEARIIAWIASCGCPSIYEKAGSCIKCREQALELISLFKRNDIVAILDYLERIEKEVLDIFVYMLQLLLSDILLLKNHIESIVNADLRSQLIKLSDQMNSKALLAATNIISQINRYGYLNITLMLPLKSALINTHPMFLVAPDEVS